MLARTNPDLAAKASDNLLSKIIAVTDDSVLPEDVLRCAEALALVLGNGRSDADAPRRLR